MSTQITSRNGRLHTQNLARDSWAGIATGYGVHGPGIESRYGGPEFSTGIQKGPGTHPASDTIGTGSCRGVKRSGRRVDHPFPSVTEVKERVYEPLPPLWVSSPLLLYSLRVCLCTKMRHLWWKRNWGMRTRCSGAGVWFALDRPWNRKPHSTTCTLFLGHLRSTARWKDQEICYVRHCLSVCPSVCLRWRFSASHKTLFWGRGSMGQRIGLYQPHKDEESKRQKWSYWDLWQATPFMATKQMTTYTANCGLQAH